jgi:VWFA-related protein
MKKRQQQKGGRLWIFEPSRAGGRVLRPWFAVFVLASTICAGQTTAVSVDEPAKPSKEISLTAFGYRGLSPLSRFTTQHDLTINFLDDDHVLLTYNPKRLIERHPECPPSHKDHMIEAKVLDLSSGKMVRQASWYVHDEHGYLWPLAQGHFLLRILNSLYLLDESLQQKLLLQSPAEILWTSVTPDGKQIILETAADDHTTNKKDQPKDLAKAKVKIEFLDAQSLAVQRTIKSSGVIPLEGTSTGFGDVVNGMSGKVWMVRFGSTSRERENIARVRSRCLPNLLFPTNTTLLIGRCSVAGSDYNVSVFTLTGHFLWRQRWAQHRYEPAIQRSEDGSRIAVSSIAGTLQPVPDTDKTGEEHWPQVEQKIDVLNAATGAAVRSTTIADAMVSAQNFSLASDGTRLAVVDGSMLRIYDLAPMSTEERAKYVAMQADAPALAAPAVHPAEEGAAAGADEDVFDVASQKSTEEQLQPVAARGSTSAANVVAPTAPGTAPTAGAANTASPAPSSSVDSASQRVNADVAVPTFRASAKTVVVDVVVTDSKGHTVKDLSEKDFQIFEDGKPQRINYFHQYKGYAGSSASGTEAEQPAAPKLPPNVFANNQLAREDEPVTVFLLDLLNTPPEAQYFAREQLIQFLKDKPKGSQFALCTLANGLRLIQGFTADEQLLIATARGKKGAVRYAPIHERNVGMDIGLKMQQEVAAFDPGKQFAVQMFQEAEAEERAQELDRRLFVTVDGFAQLARYLSGVPGRKNVVWLSGSFPLGIFPNNDLFNAFNETRNYSELMRKTANLLADSHVAVYPVDVRGLMTQSVFAASNAMNPAGAPAPGSQAPTGGQNSGALANTAANAQAPNPFMQATHESLEQQVGDQSTMDQIASDTGGKAFYNTNGIKEALQTAVEQGSEYYMLSYTPSNRNYDGKLRKIKVSLASKGHHLAYRHGYFADDPFAPLKQERDALSRDVGMAAMQHGSPQSHQILFATRVVPVGKPTQVDPAKQASAQAKKKKGPVITEVQHYAVDYAIAGSQLQFSPEGEMHHGVFDFMASAFDDDGKAISRIASRTVADLKPSSYHDTMVGGFRLHQEFDVPTNAASLRLGVEDELNRKLGTVEISLPVPPPPNEPTTAKSRSLPEIEPD